jgi:hypothetical protein
MLRVDMTTAMNIEKKETNMHKLHLSDLQAHSLWILLLPFVSDSGENDVG